MRVVILPDETAAATFAASEMADLVRRHPTAVLGLATGGTPVGAYRRLIELHRQGDLSFANVKTFNLDEYIGLSPTDAASYRSFMDSHLFDHIDIPKSHTHIPRGDAGDLERECRDYEAKILEAGGIDLQLLGIGSDGHIGFNEPGSSLAGRTRIKPLADQTRHDNARFFSSLDEVPKLAITMGIGTILDARRILLMATGNGKSAAIAAAVEGPITSSVPASALQLHPQVTVVLDAAAASQLRHKNYYLQAEFECQRLRNEL